MPHLHPPGASTSLCSGKGPMASSSVKSILTYATHWPLDTMVSHSLPVLSMNLSIAPSSSGYSCEKSFHSAGDLQRLQGTFWLCGLGLNQCYVQHGSVAGSLGMSCGWVVFCRDAIQFSSLSTMPMALSSDCTFSQMPRSVLTLTQGTCSLYSLPYGFDLQQTQASADPASFLSKLLLMDVVPPSSQGTQYYMFSTCTIACQRKTLTRAGHLHMSNTAIRDRGQDS